MKRAFWILAATVPLVVWLLTRNSQETPAFAPAGDAPAEPLAAAPVATAPVAEAAQEATIPESPEQQGPLDPVAEGEPIQVLDGEGQVHQAFLLSIDLKQALVGGLALPEQEKVRLIVPFEGQAITIHAQVNGLEGDQRSLKILTMKAGQKRRFEDYLQRRP